MPNITSTPREKGNVFLYILIAVALFGALSFVISRTQDSGDQAQLPKAKLEINTNKIMDFATTAQNVYLQMEQTNTDIDEISLLKPEDAGFNTAPNYHKLFHPEGGGLTFMDMTSTDFTAGISSADPGWHVVKVNADWTATSGTDLVLTFIDLRADICAEINKKLTGATTIPTVTVNYTNTFINGTSALQQAQCAECETYNAICLQNGDGYAYYVMLGTR